MGVEIWIQELKVNLLGFLLHCKSINLSPHFASQ